MEWSPSDNLILIEKIRQNLSVGIVNLFQTVSEELEIPIMDCFSQFIKLQFGKEVQQPAQFRDIKQSQQDNKLEETVKKAILTARREEARALLELEAAIE